MLDINHHPILLLMVCVPSIFIFGMMSIGSTCVMMHQELDIMVTTGSLTILTNLLTLLQVMIQTPLIVDGLRRCSSSERTDAKLGKEILMFLIMANLVVYIYETLMLKTNVYSTELDFFGYAAWTLLSHMTLPLCIFYR